jgi:hypothetical protein
MIRHIVVFRLNAADAERRHVDATGLKSRLEPLKDVIPGVLSLEVHIDQGLIATHWDAVLVADYPSNEALEAYQSHPEHVAAVTWVNTVVADRAVVDYEIA